jgi:hypothetical protein
MSRERALAILRRLARGLSADMAGSARLMERISQHDEAETLRSALAELGAQALLEAAPASPDHQARGQA